MNKDTEPRFELGRQTKEKHDMNDDIEKGRPGQFFEEFLKEQVCCEETTERAVKRVLAWQLAEAMKQQGISKMEMARR